tara:strand:+ start:1599 stop:1805 length:207 start_codon:yes stop_codon:yes gene_type:complete
MRVRAIQTCFIGNRLREVGSEFEYDGPVKGEACLVAVEEEEPVEEAPVSPAPSQPFGKKAKKKSSKRD